MSLISLTSFSPIEIEEVVHSPTPSKVRTPALLNGDGKKALDACEM